MLALILAASIICVDPGNTVAVQVDVGFAPLYGGGFSAEDPSVATASGPVRARERVGEAIVKGVAPGETRLILTYLSGISIYRVPLRTIKVGGCKPSVPRRQKCNARDEPAVTVPEPTSIVLEGSPLTLTAMTSGEGPFSVDWFEGTAFLGVGSPITLTLPGGVHRITAQVWNRCGHVSDDVEVTVVGSDRRRSARH